jgi:hypothetical protein
MVDCQFLNSNIARQISFVNSTLGAQEVAQTSPTAFV